MRNLDFAQHVLQTIYYIYSIKHLTGLLASFQGSFYSVVGIEELSRTKDPSSSGSDKKDEKKILSYFRIHGKKIDYFQIAEQQFFSSFLAPPRQSKIKFWKAQFKPKTE